MYVPMCMRVHVCLYVCPYVRIRLNVYKCLLLAGMNICTCVSMYDVTDLHYIYFVHYLSVCLYSYMYLICMYVRNVLM
jgi:hypothetical protein